jgi:hypothetical protein
MAGWMDNPIMTWAGTKITDHGRGPLSMKTEAIGTDKRMADGTLRRQRISIKRTWDITWENLPSTNTVSTGFKTADGQYSGEQIEAFYRANAGKFRMILRRGSAINIADPNPAESALPYQDQNFYVVNVMFTDFSKTVKKRGNVDLWDISVTLEEV